MSTHPSRACVRVRCFQNTRVHTTSVTLGQGHSALSNKLGLTLSLAWRLQDLKAHLRAGVTLDELWRVARGELRYADWLKQRGGLGGGSPGGSGAGGVGAAPAAPPAASVPQELVNVQAYLLWEKARASVAASFTAWLPLHAAAPACSYGSRRGLTVIVCQGRSQAIMIHLPDDMVECSSGAAHRPHEVIRRLWCDVQGGSSGVQPDRRPDAPASGRDSGCCPGGPPGRRGLCWGRAAHAGGAAGSGQERGRLGEGSQVAEAAGERVTCLLTSCLCLI